MRTIVQRIRNRVMYFSMQERKQREYARYEEEVQKLESMSELQLQSEYISVKAKYEHRKSILSLFLVSIVLAILTNVWKYFSDFLNQLLQFTLADQADSGEIAKVGFIISTIVVVCITVVVFLFLFASVRKSNALYRRLLMIEDVKNSHKGS